MGFNSAFKGLKPHSAWVCRDARGYRRLVSIERRHRFWALHETVLGWLVRPEGPLTGRTDTSAVWWSNSNELFCYLCLCSKHVSRWFQRSELRVLLRASHMQPYEFSITKFEPPCWKLSDYLSSLHILQGDQKVSVHVMITIQKFTSNDMIWLLVNFCMVIIRCTEIFDHPVIIYDMIICLLFCMGVKLGRWH